MIDPKSGSHNYVIVAGIRSPGRARLTGVEAPFQWDVIPSYGREGAKTIFKGRGIAKPTLTLWFTSKADPATGLTDFVQWELFKRVLQPPKPGKPFMFEMSHPLLTAADIKAVSVESIGEPERQDNGVWVVTIKLIEYRPPKPALVKPRGAIPSPDKAPPITPQTAAQKAAVEAVADLEKARNRGRQ
jgi:hypothetical protein